jgi:hypothetical protein
MANRFDTPQGTRFNNMQTYVQMPLEAMAGLAKDYSDKYKQGESLPSNIDMFYQSVKAAPVHEALKQSWYSDAKKEMTDLVNNAKESDYADPQWQRKANYIINKYKTDPRLATIQSTYNFWDKEGQKYLNSDDYNKNINFDKLKDNQGNWIQTDKNIQNIEHLKYSNHLTDVAKIMDKPEAYGDNAGSGIQKDNNGYFIVNNNKREYIKPEQIDFIADSNLNNYVTSEGGNFRFKALLDQAGYNPRMSYQDFMSDKNVPQEIKQQARDILKSDLTGYGSKYIHTKNSGNITMKNDVLALKKKLDEDNLQGLGQATPGSTIYDLTNGIDSDIKDAFQLKNGKVHFDVTKLPAEGGAYSQFSADRGNKNTKSHEKAAQWILEAAKSIGYNGKITSGSTLKDPKTGEIKVMGYDDIATEYLNLAKSVSYDYKMLPQENEIVKNDIVEYPENYTYTKKDGTVVDYKTIADKISNKDNLNIGNRIYKNEQAYIETQYLNDSGKPETLYAQPLAKQDKEYHDGIARVQKQSLDFLKTRKPSNDKITKMVTNYLELNKENNYKGAIPINSMLLPNNNIVYTLGDENNPKELQYEMLTTNGEIVTFNNLPHMMAVVNKDWFSTNEGKGQSNNYAPKNKAYTDLINQLTASE